MTAPSSAPSSAVAHGHDGTSGIRDREPPATERKTIATLTLIAGLMLMAPRQWVSGVFLILVAGALFWRHRVLLRRATAAVPAVTPTAATAPGAEAQPADPAAVDPAPAPFAEAPVAEPAADCAEPAAEPSDEHDAAGSLSGARPYVVDPRARS